MGESTYHITVDYNQTLVEMIAAGCYDLTDDDVTENNFPIYGSGILELDAWLIRIYAAAGIDFNLKWLDEKGYRPGTLPELLAFGRQYPDLQRDHTIIALGSVWRDRCGYRNVACLTASDRKRLFGLTWHEFEWEFENRFLAVKK